jgi:hypothetical protein
MLIVTEGLNVTAGDSHRRRTHNVTRKMFQPDEVDDEDTPSLATSDVTVESYSFGDDSSRELSADSILIEQVKVMRAGRTEKQRPQPDSLRTRKVCANIETRTKKYIYPSMLQNAEFKEAIKIVASNICAEIGDNTDFLIFSTANAHKKTMLTTFIYSNLDAPLKEHKIRAFISNGASPSQLVTPLIAELMDQLLVVLPKKLQHTHLITDGENVNHDYPFLISAKHLLKRVFINATNGCLKVTEPIQHLTAELLISNALSQALETCSLNTTKHAIRNELEKRK